MSSIASPFTIHTLPAATAQSFHVSTPNSNTLDIAVTGAGISRIKLRPAPRVLASVAISPLAEVLCPAVVVAQKNAGITTFAVIRERQRNIYLRRLEENGRVIETKLDEEVAGLYFLAVGIVVVIFRSGKTAAFKITRHGNEVEQFDQVWSVNLYDNGSQLLYSKFYDGTEDEVSLLLVGRQSSKVLDVRKYKITSSEARQAYKRNILNTDDKDQLEHIQFHESGVLFRLLGTSLQLITVPTLTCTTVDFAPFLTSLASQKKPLNLSYLPVGRSTILLSTGTSVLLIDWQYKTVLATLDLPDSDTFTLVTRVGKRAAVGTTKTGQIQVIIFSGGTGKLLECVAGKLRTISRNEDKPVLANIFFTERYSSRKYKTDAKAAFNASKKEVENIIAQLQALKQSGDVAGFDERLLPFLTGKSELSEVGNDQTSKKSAKRVKNLDSRAKPVTANKDKTSYFSNAASRQVDPLLISSITDLMFETEDDRLKLSVFRSRSLKYILSHPLFPMAKYPDLLTALSSDPQLLMTAVQYTRGLSIDALLAVLTSNLLNSCDLGPVDIKIVNLIVSRVEKDFSYKTIVTSLRTKYQTTVLQGALESLMALLSKPIVAPSTFDVWNIVPCFIDASGILSIQQNVISSLAALVDEEIQDLMGRVEVLEMVDVALDWSRRRRVRNAGSGIDGVVTSVGLMKTSRV
ncbi:U3 small nucleolar RNA-associated protein 8 [Lipomyces kononenkoae]|uniref:U3 small nucleolar RNA-associated protein 8 n=1 Tax=Lipomyces kononenkoae TaxID=34357 RepID=A0ACC3T768_LIPKO